VPVFGQALGTSIADPVQNFRYRDGGSFRRDPGRRHLSSNLDRAMMSMRISTVLHPTMLLALANGSNFQQYRPSPALDRAISKAPLPEHQHHELH